MIRFLLLVIFLNTIGMIRSSQRDDWDMLTVHGSVIVVCAVLIIWVDYRQANKTVNRMLEEESDDDRR